MADGGRWRSDRKTALEEAEEEEEEGGGAFPGHLGGGTLKQH